MYGCSPRPARSLGRSLALVAGLALAAAAHGAAGYPDRPVHVVVAFTAGGTTDNLARSLGQQLGQRLKQSFVVENRPGAGGNIGTEYVARAPADGYTLLVGSVGPITINQTLYKKLNHDPLTDLLPVVQIADVPNVLVLHPSLPVGTLEEFIAYLKAHPGRLHYGSTGVGTSSHLSGVMLTGRIDAPATHVPYKGADALNDLLAGRIQFMFATIPSVIAHIRAGKLNALAVSSAARSRALPDLPTVAEKGLPGFEASSWFGLFAPKDTPKAVIATLNQAVNEALAPLQAQMTREGADPAGGSPEQFGQFVLKEYAKWRSVVQAAGIVIE